MLDVFFSTETSQAHQEKRFISCLYICKILLCKGIISQKKVPVFVKENFKFLWFENYTTKVRGIKEFLKSNDALVGAGHYQIV